MRRALVSWLATASLLFAFALPARAAGSQNLNPLRQYSDSIAALVKRNWPADGSEAWAPASCRSRRESARRCLALGRRRHPFGQRRLGLQPRGAPRGAGCLEVPRSVRASDRAWRTALVRRLRAGI